MKTIYIFLAAVFACTAAAAQSTDEILGRIEDNNLTLKALRQQVEAQGDANLAESSLEGPEVEFGYLFGDDGRRRHDFGVSQSFDFGALSGARRKLALGENELLALEYRASRRDILTAARKLVCQIVHSNALIEEYRHRVENARTVELAYRSGYEKGEFSVIDYRKAAVSLAEAEGNLRLLEVERDGMLAELRNLNGGEAIDISACEQEHLGTAAEAQPQRGLPEPFIGLQVRGGSRRRVQGCSRRNQHTALVGRKEDFQREKADRSRENGRAGRPGAVQDKCRESLQQGYEACRIRCGSRGCG